MLQAIMRSTCSFPRNLRLTTTLLRRTSHVMPSIHFIITHWCQCQWLLASSSSLRLCREHEFLVLWLIWPNISWLYSLSLSIAMWGLNNHQTESQIPEPIITNEKIQALVFAIGWWSFAITCVCVCALFIDKLPNGLGPERPAKSLLRHVATAPALWPCYYTRMNQAEQGCELLAISSFLKLHATSHAPQQIGLTTKRKL